MILKNNIKYLLLIAAVIMNDHTGYAQYPGTGDQVIYKDDFNADQQYWVAEFEKPATSEMKIGDGKLDINASAGATIWYRNKLKGNIMITYNATVVDAGGKNDRVSDMNAFWMATNPLSENMFNQNGKFSSYDSLHLYYAGIGGHDNTTTRFRKYTGNGAKDVLKAYSDKAHLLAGNQKYAVKIIVNKGIVQFYIDDILFWEYRDASPYREGYFGFRTTTSHQVYEDFNVYQL